MNNVMISFIVGLLYALVTIGIYSVGGFWAVMLSVSFVCYIMIQKGY